MKVSKLFFWGIGNYDNEKGTFVPDFSSSYGFFEHDDEEKAYQEAKNKVKEIVGNMFPYTHWVFCSGVTMVPRQNNEGQDDECSKTAEYVDADLCEECGRKVIWREYQDSDGYIVSERVCKCGIHTD